MRITIFIKSFNRAFYLDRCISSIYQNITGAYDIVVLDDGTPAKYLEKIQQAFPEVVIKKSDNYNQKVEIVAENIRNGININGFKIPTSFWYENIKNATEYFIVTEDDVWFTRTLDVDQLKKKARKFDVYLLKLGWLGNKKDKENLDLKPISQSINAATPKSLLLLPKPLMTAFFYNRYKFFSILYKLGQVNNATQRKYWSLNSILMGFYKKEYWLEIWKGMDEKVDEKKQLINASSFYNTHKKNKNFVSRLKVEAMKTTFQSSATNSYHDYGFDFDVNLFNHLINEAWHAGEFDPMQNYPNDFSLSYFEEFVSEKINIVEFRKWVEQFKKQYRDLGCNTN